MALSLPSMDATMARAAAVAGRRGRVSVLLPEASARVVLLPWQVRLLAGPQLQAYARACFERSGLRLDGEWALHGGYRHFGRAGLAAAVPIQLLRDLRSAAVAHGLRLTRAIPVSAAAYWHRHRSLRKHGALFLCEPDRLTLLRCDRGRVATMDVQPVGDDAALALRRLARRDANPAPEVVELWAPPGQAIERDHFVQQYAGVPLHVFRPAAWSGQ